MGAEQQTGPHGTTVDLPTFGPEGFFGFWRIQSSGRFNDSSNDIFIIAIYEGEIWFHRYNNAKREPGCYSLDRYEVPYELMWETDGALSVKLQSVEGTPTSFTEFTHSVGEDTLIRHTIQEGDLYDETVFTEFGASQLVKIWAIANSIDQSDSRVRPSTVMERKGCLAHCKPYSGLTIGFRSRKVLVPTAPLAHDCETRLDIHSRF